jgi:hypothetical protein
MIDDRRGVEGGRRGPIGDVDPEYVPHPPGQPRLDRLPDSIQEEVVEQDPDVGRLGPDRAEHPVEIGQASRRR